MTITEIKEEIVSEWEAFEALLSESLDSGSDLLNRINGYILSASGKQLRPLLAIVSAKASGGFADKNVLACATASELIHTATLLHDDVVDNSDRRRGKETVGNLFSPGASILMGDYWLTRAMHILISNNSPYSVLALFSKALGDLAEGELMQMEFAESLDAGFEDYIAIISRKTASLFVAAVKSAAIVCGADESRVAALEEYAYSLGLSFQMRDDILDYASSSVTGKDSNCDIEERKVTLPLLAVLDKIPSASSRIREEMRHIVLSGSEVERAQNRIIADRISRFVIDNDGIAAALLSLSEYIDRAVGALDALPESLFKRALVSIAYSLKKIPDSGKLS